MVVRQKILPAARRRRQIEIAQSRSCPIAFARYVFELDLADVHVRWLEMWRDHPQSVVHSSVGLGKSTLVRAFVLWLIGRDDSEMVLWVGATQKQPRIAVGSMKAMIESPGVRHRLHHVFPRLRPGRNWRSTEIEVAREASTDVHPSISAFGAFAESVLGSRATTLVLDDICTWSNTLTEDARTKLIDWLQVVFTRLTKAGIRVIVLGNYWHKDDATMSLARRPGFIYSRVPAYVLAEDGETRIPTAPQCLDLEKIARLEAQLGPIASSRMLQCQAAAIDVGRFRARGFAAALEAGRGQPFRPAKVHGPTFTGVDLGHTKKVTSDRTSMVTVTILNDGRRQIVDVRSGRWDSVEIRRNLAEIYAAWQPIIGVETNGGQGLVAEMLAEALTIPLCDHHTGVNKYSQAHGVEHLAIELAQGWWIFPCPREPALDSRGASEPGDFSPAGSWSLESKPGGQPHHEIQELINEGLVYDPAKHPGDRLMAWWICAEVLRKSAVGALESGAGSGAASSDDYDWMAR